SLNARLWSVSCPTPKSCVAVGNDRFAKTLVEHWNGKTWTIQTPQRRNATLWSVSCPSPTSCYAVGDPDRTLGPLVLRWNGQTWAAQATINPTGSTYAYLGRGC